LLQQLASSLAQWELCRWPSHYESRLGYAASFFVRLESVYLIASLYQMVEESRLMVIIGDNIVGFREWTLAL
jgi:hypothetical protein